MKPTTWLYVGAVILFLISACGLGVGGFIYLGSTAGHSEWVPLSTALMCVGALAILGGIALMIFAIRKTKAENPQNITYKVDLPGETRIEEMKCRSCGGTLTADNIKMVNGAPMVNCPYCNTVYQLSEEPKW
ncbi:MAG: hypothetical protein Fur0043_15420 [Anaerolineales bacterium]